MPEDGSTFIIVVNHICPILATLESCILPQ